MAEQFRRYGTLALLTVGLLWFVRFPVADCFDCEGSNAWGQADHIYNERALAATLVILSFCFLAGLLRPRFYWLVPVGTITAYVFTMHLAGVAWWSVKDNEGPIAYFLGLPTGYIALSLGIIIRRVSSELRSPNSSKAHTESEV